MKLFQTKELTPSAQALFDQQHNQLCASTDRLFAALMILQWAGGMLAAILISPRTWIGTTSQVHFHVWAALFLGTAVSSFPVYLGFRYPGRKLTRNVIAVAQVCWSALLIHFTGGRIETHFHVFVSLAFLSFYREWRLLILPTIVVALDHAIRGIWWPQSVYGVFVESPFRWLEHAAWVAFEFVVLAGSCQRGRLEMQQIAERQDELETTNQRVEDAVRQRTHELAASERKLAASESRLRTLLDSSVDPLLTMTAQAKVLSASQSVATVFGWKPDELIGNNANLLIAELGQDEHSPVQAKGRAEGNSRDDTNGTGGKFLAPFQQKGAADLLGKPQEMIAVRRTGHHFPCQITVWQVVLPDEREPIYMGTIRDITERKKAEAELVSLNQRLVDAAHQAGKAEIANSVLHNVGNVLNSVNVSAEIVREKVGELGIGNLTRLATVVEEHEDDFSRFVSTDDRGKHLPRFLIDLSHHMASEERLMVEEVQALISHIDHIKTVISTQQAYAKSGMVGVAEPVDLTDLIRDAVHVNTSSMRRHHVEVNCEFAELKPTIVDKHKLLQILINLISNAKYACMESNHDEHCISIRLRRAGDDRVQIEVNDNGVGISNENLTRIFAHGFTTRSDGHGFGLHSAAVAAEELKATLSAHSDGNEQGSTFVLDLPYSPAEVPTCKM